MDAPAVPHPGWQSSSSGGCLVLSPVWFHTLHLHACHIPGIRCWQCRASSFHVWWSSSSSHSPPLHAAAALCLQHVKIHKSAAKSKNGTEMSWKMCCVHNLLAWNQETNRLNTFHTIEQVPHSADSTVGVLGNTVKSTHKSLIPQTLLLVFWETQSNQHTSPSFRKLYCWSFGKHSQINTQGS